MKIEKITDSIFRVTISLTDLEQRDIDINSIDVNSPQTMMLLQELMEQAALQFGYDFSGTQLIIDPVPNRNNSFDITISKLDDDIDFESIHKYIRNRYKRSEITAKKRTSSLYTNLMSYSFKSLDDVEQLAYLISPIYIGISSLYKLEGQYYLILSKNQIKSRFEHQLECHLSEFGTKINNPVSFEGFVVEHGELIIANHAIEHLSSF